MFERSWVRIPAPYTGWTFFLIDLMRKLFVWKDENKRKRGLGWPIFKKDIFKLDIFPTSVNDDGCLPFTFKFRWIIDALYFGNEHWRRRTITKLLLSQVELNWRDSVLKTVGERERESLRERERERVIEKDILRVWSSERERVGEAKWRFLSASARKRERYLYVPRECSRLVGRYYKLEEGKKR